MKGDSIYMMRALNLARKGLGRTAPNPPVGAVVVKNGRVVGEGFHPKAGLAHAEVFALQAAGEEAKGATLYVTLEPCSHFGKTPPCTDAVIKAGIARVVVGSVDPNPVVAGKGIRILREHGIKVDVGIKGKETAKRIEWYAKWMKEKRPYVIVKVAMTLDGRIATLSGDSKWISSEESRKYVHELRNHVDAVLVGVGTVAKDDPLLTCRIEGGRDPLRIIIDPRFEVPASAKCLGRHTMIFTFRDPSSRLDVVKSGAKIVQLSVGPDGRFSWESIWMFLGGMGLHSVLVEGGSTILSSLIKSRLVDEILVFIAPKLLGGGIPVVSWEPPDTIAESLPLVITGVKTIGDDVLVSARLEG